MLPKPTNVIFRKLKTSKETIAIFPELPGSQAWYANCLGYTSKDKFCTTSLSLNDYSLPISREECKPLIKELTSMGYNLNIVPRFKETHITARKASIDYQSIQNGQTY